MYYSYCFNKELLFSLYTMSNKVITLKPLSCKYFISVEHDISAQDIPRLSILWLLV